VVQWFIYKGYKKVRAVRLGFGALKKEGFAVCPFETMTTKKRKKKK